MTEPLKLMTTKVEISEAVVETAEELLADAKAGRINAFVAVARMTGGGARPYISGAIRYPEMIGYIELVKIDWATDYLRSN